MFFAILTISLLIIGGSIPLMWSKKIIIKEDVIENDINIKFSKYKRMETISLELKDKKACDINLDFYDIHNDTLSLKRSISTSEFVYAKYRMDWYSKNLIIKSSDSLECKMLDVDLVISYWLDLKLGFSK